MNMSLYTGQPSLTWSKSEKCWHFHSKAQEPVSFFWNKEAAGQTCSCEGKDSQGKCHEALVLKYIQQDRSSPSASGRVWEDGWKQSLSFLPFLSSRQPQVKLKWTCLLPHPSSIHSQTESMSLTEHSAHSATACPKRAVCDTKMLRTPRVILWLCFSRQTLKILQGWKNAWKNPVQTNKAAFLRWMGLKTLLQPGLIFFLNNSL